MKVGKDPNIFLQHILENILKIEVGIGDMSEVEFSQNVDMQDATLRRLEVIGEAVRNIPDSFRATHPQIPWKKIAGLRDMLIHEYFGVDMGLVWKVVDKDIPKLKKQVTNLLKEI